MKNKSKYILLTIGFLMFFAPLSVVEACQCSGNTKICCNGNEAYPSCGDVGNCLLCCKRVGQVSYPDSSFPNCHCCDSVSFTTCSCGCSNGSCNPTCTAGWGSCSAGDTDSTDSYACGSRTYTNSCCSTTDTETCWCDCGCTPGDPPSCPTGTTDTAPSPSVPLYPSGQTDYYSYTESSCDRNNGVSQNNCDPKKSIRTRDCYCEICEPALCSTSGYYDSMQYDEWGNSQGQVPNNLTPSCRNGQGAPDQLSKCDMTYRTCYCPSCLKQCPSPLTNTGSPKLILNDFRECTNDCSVKPPENQDDCYETESPQPREFLTIVKDPPGYTNHYGFSSITHTGDRLPDTTNIGTLNDPFYRPIKMRAEYEDANGASDIEGMFVWFRGEQYTGELGTPIFLSDTADPKTSAKDSWGFMLRRMGGVWQPYVPSYNGGDVFWTMKNTSGNVFSINGPSGGKMIEVTIISITEEDNTVSMEFSLRFSDDNGELFSDNVSEGLYRIYLMGLDKFSFTPYDNYNIEYGKYWTPQFKYSGETTLLPYWQPNQLRYKPEQSQLYARDWFLTDKTWTIDRKAPTLKEINKTVLDNSITLSWEVSDDRNLYAIVGNIFTSGDDVKTITVSTGTEGVSLHDPITFSLNSENNGVEEDKIGILNNMGVSLFQVNPNIDGKEHSGSVTLNVNPEAQNSLSFFITVFDDAGNIAQSEEIKQDLNDWMVTSGGLAYSAEGTSFTVKELASGIWNNILPPSSYGRNPGLIPPDVNLTSEMWGETGGLINFKPSSPLDSYSLRFNGIKLVEEDGYYTLLLDSYEKNKKNLGDKVREKTVSGDIEGAVNDDLYCPEPDKEYCVLKSTADVRIKSNFACNKKTLMFIDGSLEINPPLKNSVNTDILSGMNGCIFVVSGNVYIKEGSNASNSGFGYDKVNGYILADGQIIIDDESYKRGHNRNPVIDGVYINGGLQSSKSNYDKSILFNRYLRLEDRLKFPLLAIDLHPKYGVLGEEFFGSKYIIQTVELGVKP